MAGEDRYTPTQDLLVAPPIVRIAPGATQIFRVTLRNQAPVEAERAYRLVLEDVSAVTAGEQGMVTLRFRHNLPLFATPRQAPLIRSRWHRCVAPADKACVQLDNEGNRRVRLSNLAVEGPGWRKDIPGGATVLAGASRKWMFDLRVDQLAASRVIVTTDLGVVDAPVGLSEPTP